MGQGKSCWDTEKTSKYDWHKVCLQEKSLIDFITKNNFTIICEKFDQIQGNINGLNMTIRAKKLIHAIFIRHYEKFNE